MLDIFFKLAIFFYKKHLFISLSTNCKIKIAYVWTGPYGHLAIFSGHTGSAIQSNLCVCESLNMYDREKEMRRMQVKKERKQALITFWQLSFNSFKSFLRYLPTCLPTFLRGRLISVHIELNCKVLQINQFYFKLTVFYLSEISNRCDLVDPFLKILSTYKTRMTPTTSVWVYFFK